MQVQIIEKKYEEASVNPIAIPNIKVKDSIVNPE